MPSLSRVSVRSCQLVSSVFALSIFVSTACGTATTQDDPDQGVVTPGEDMSVLPLDMPAPQLDMGAPAADMPPGQEDMKDDMDMSWAENLILDPGHQYDTAAQLAAFYDTYGARDTFPQENVNAFEALLYAEDDLIAGNPDAAINRVDAIFDVRPQGDVGWPFGGTAGSNIGSPVGYYGMRMIEHIDEITTSPGQEPLIMTGVVATCTDARIPQPGGAAPKMERFDLHPGILADDARRLFLATGLFRKWVEAITRGRRVDLRIYVIEGCTTTDFTLDPGYVRSYANSNDMLSKVPAQIADETDLWWVVAPSGIRNTESELGRHPITGGMGLSSDGRPLFLSDDLWFMSKPEHMGTGDWIEAEVRAYHPQWFQHEFMHHLYRTWPELGLEASGHQWFDRNTWPADFVGTFEPDYYYESINKRLLSVSPSLSEGLSAPDFAGADQFALSDFSGRYERLPVENPWHQVTVSLGADNKLTWTNDANVSWSRIIDGDTRKTGPDCPYGELDLKIMVDDQGAIEAFVLQGETYVRMR